MMMPTICGCRIARTKLCPGFNEWKDEELWAISETYKKFIISKCECVRGSVEDVKFACLDQGTLWEAGESC